MFSGLIQLRKLFIPLTILVFISSCGKPEITHVCTANGFGKITCDFQNSGNAKGSKCLKIKYTRNQNMIFEKTFDFETIKSVDICSGVVESGDVRERQLSGAFNNKNVFVTPADFCFVENWSDKEMTWYDGCLREDELVN